MQGSTVLGGDHLARAVLLSALVQGELLDGDAAKVQGRLSMDDDTVAICQLSVLFWSMPSLS